MNADARAKSVPLAVTSAPATLAGDERLLTSALINLVKNAVQAAPEGSRVEVTGRLESRRYVIEVADHGPGVAKENQAKIFEPFFTTREKGTGLGLPLARKLVEAHRGSLVVSSTPGDTTFRIELPLP